MEKTREKIEMGLRLAFGHQARVGKDTLAALLKEKYGGKILHFSDKLYEILYFAQNTCGFPQAKDTKFLQWVGTEWGRNQDSDVWVKATLKNLQTEANYFVADLRFPNEAKALKEDGFTLIKIVRSDRPIDRDTGHISETALSNYEGWDFVLENNGSIEELVKKLEAIMKF